MLLRSSRFLVPLGFAALAAAFLAPALFFGRVLLPTDNLFQWPPWSAYAAQFGVALPPHNPLISDAILQNYPWKRFIAAQLGRGELPLWNPYLFAGQPFLAAGQSGALYPLGLLFVLLPTAQAYGWFTALHLAIAGSSTYYLVRVLGGSRLGGWIAGVAFAFGLPLVVTFLWPMVVSTLAWMPLLVALVERTLRLLLDERGPARRWLPYPVLGALVVGLVLLAGHLEFAFYTLAVAGLYAAGRLLAFLLARPRPEADPGALPAAAAGGATVPLGRALAGGAVLLAMVALGVALAAVQLVPFAELGGRNFRAGLLPYEEVRSFAFRPQHVAAFLLPNVFGNPTHHAYRDLFDGTERPVAHEFADRPGQQERSTSTEWGQKNYVEGAAYVGVLPLLLAPLALLRRRPPVAAPVFAGIAVVAALLAFGSPLYALLFYGLPGYSQLHTPFRWVYPLTFSLVVLAGLADLDPRPAGAGRPLGKGADRAAVLGLLAAALGLLLLAGLAAAWLLRGAVLPALDALVAGSGPLKRGFADGRMLFSYQAVNLGLLGLLLLGGGLLLRLRRRLGRAFGGAAVALLVADLFLAGGSFNTFGDPAPLAFEPPAITFLKQQPRPFRFTTFGPGGELNANLGMLHDLEDVRGYDSTIFQDYVEYLSLIEGQGGLIYNRISPLYNPDSLRSPLLHLLNVRYVVTSERLSLPDYPLVYEGEVRIYRNERALPRAFLVGAGVAAADAGAALALLRRPDFDPSQTVVLEGVAPDAVLRGGGGAPGTAAILRHEPNEVAVRAVADRPAYLVLTDTAFPGWTVAVDGRPAELLRANRIFRAVRLEPGEHEVVFAYRPLSFRVGALASFVALVVLGLAGGVWLWLRTPALATPRDAVQTVAKNSLLPMGAALVNKLLDFGFALVLLRVLDPEQVGSYTFAVVTVTLLDVLIDYGLGALITREVAKNPAAAGRYLGGALLLRSGFWLAALAVSGLIAGPLAGPLGVNAATGLTLLLLTLGLLPSAIAAALAALLRAAERMEAPAAVAIGTTVLKVTLGLGALLAGAGIVGLAAVSLVVNLCTLAALGGLTWRLLGPPRPELDLRFAGELIGASFPLMVNNLLAGLFYRVDALLLKPLVGSAALGYYGTAYKFIDGLNIIPSNFTLALFPLLSREAAASGAGLRRAAVQSLRLLLLLALPISVGTTLLAEEIVATFAGPQWVPESAWALQVLIWFLPGSFANSFLQYVLIARNQQRFLTRAFLLGAGFNLVANLWAIPRYGYLGAAATTVLSELVLLVPFWWAARADAPVGAVLGALWRPALAALAMGLVVLATRDALGLLCVPLGALVYGAGLVGLGTFSAEDRKVVRRVLGRA